MTVAELALLLAPIPVEAGPCSNLILPKLNLSFMVRLGAGQMYPPMSHGPTTDLCLSERIYFPPDHVIGKGGLEVSFALRLISARVMPSFIFLCVPFSIFLDLYDSILSDCGTEVRNASTHVFTEWIIRALFPCCRKEGCCRWTRTFQNVVNKPIDLFFIYSILNPKLQGGTKYATRTRHHAGESQHAGKQGLTKSSESSTSIPPRSSIHRSISPLTPLSSVVMTVAPNPSRNSVCVIPALRNLRSCVLSMQIFILFQSGLFLE
jgi:hypothetical protein